MAKPPKPNKPQTTLPPQPVTAAPVTVVLPPIQDMADLPVVQSLGWAPVAKGWVVLELETQGNEVIGKSVLYGPAPKAVAAEQMRILLDKQILWPAMRKAARAGNK